MCDNILGVELVDVPSSTPKASQFISVQDIHEVLHHVMKLKPTDLEGLQKNSPKPGRYDVYVKSMEIYNSKNLNRLLYKKAKLCSGKTVLITKAFEETRSVRVKRMPMFWKCDKVKRIFSWYGDIHSVEREKWKTYDDFNGYGGLWNGTYLIQMVVRRDIPSTITIAGHRLEVFYKGQPGTCWRCGGDHLKSECTTPWRYFTNRFDIDDFPVLESSVVLRDEPGQSATSSRVDNDEDFIDESHREHCGQVNNDADENKATVVDDNDGNVEDKVNNDNETEVTNVNVEDENVDGGAVVSDTTDSVKCSHVEQEIVQQTEAETTNDISNGESEAVVTATIGSVEFSPVEQEVVQQTESKTASSEVVKDKEPIETNVAQTHVLRIDPVDIHHTDDSQNVVEAISSPQHPQEEEIWSDAERTWTASEMEEETRENILIITGPDGKLTKEQEQLWTVIGSSKRDRHVMQSSGTEDEAETTIRVGFGSLVNSFFNRSNKKQKEDDSDDAKP